MSYQFNIFTIETKIKQNTNRLAHLTNAIQKITKNSELVQVRSVERINKVALFTVNMPHTSEYTLKLGCGYFAKVKTNSAIQIIKSRIKYIQEQNKKWDELKDKLIKQKDKAATHNDNIENGTPGRTIQAIGQNQQGQQVFNIVEFEDFNPIHTNKNAHTNQMLNIIPQKEQEHTQQSQIKGKQTSQNKTQKFQQSLQQKNNCVIKQQIKAKQIVEEKPKKMSKFKSQRIKMKQKQ